MADLNSQNQEQEEVSEVEKIISSQSFLKSQQDLYFVCDYLQGFTYINNQIIQYQGDSNVIAKLVPHLQIKSIKKGEAIYKKGQKNEYVYFIMKGKVSSWKSKSKESIDQEKNIINQIEKLQKLIEFEAQLKQDKKSKQENEKKIPLWEKDIDQLKKQLNILQKYDFKLSSIFQNEEGINTTSLEKIYNRRIDIFGYSNNLYNTRPANTTIAEADCQFLYISGEDFYNVFNKEVQKIKFLIRVLYTQFSNVDNTILLALAQQFKSIFYDLNQEIYSLNPQQHTRSQNQHKKSQNIFQTEQNSNLAFFIIQDGSILVKEIHNGSDYNIFSLGQESMLGIEKYSPTFNQDFSHSNNNIKFICTSNKLQLLGVTKKAIEEVQQTHNSHQIQHILTELGQQRSKFIIQHLEQIKKLLNPQQINRQSTQFNHRDQLQNRNDQSKNVSKYGFVNNIQRADSNQEQNQQIEYEDDGDDTRLMLKFCQKSKKFQISQLQETENQKSQAYLKSIVNNMLKFRPSKQNINQIQDANKSPLQISRTVSESNSKMQFSQVNKDSSSISNKQKIQDNQQTHHEKLRVSEKSLFNNYLSESSTPISQNIDKKSNKSKLSNQPSIDFTKEVNIQKSSMFQQKNTAKNFLSNQEGDKSPTPRRLEISSVESQNDTNIDWITLDSKGNKIYEKYYRQLSIEDIGEIKQNNTNQEQKKIIYKQQNSQQSEGQTNIQKNNVSFQLKVDSPASSQQKNGISKQVNNQDQQNVKKNRINFTTRSKNNSQVSIVSKSIINKQELRRQLQFSNFDGSPISDRLNFLKSSRNSQDSLLIQEEFLAQELQLDEDFELKNGKLIQKKPPSFSDLRQDFISSDNPYRQCADLIEKYKMISESNKQFIEKNCQDYYKQIQKQVDDQKQILKLKKQKQSMSKDKSSLYPSRVNKLSNSQIIFKSQKISSIQTDFQTPRSQQNQQDSLNSSRINQNFSLNRPYSSLISSDSPLIHSPSIGFQSLLQQYNNQNQLPQNIQEQQLKQSVFSLSQSLFQPQLNQNSQGQKVQNQAQIESSPSQNMYVSLNLSKFGVIQDYITDRQTTLKQVQKIESTIQKPKKKSNILTKQNIKNEVSSDYFNQASNNEQQTKQLENMSNFSFQNNNINDSSLLMIRSLKTANKKQFSRPQSVQIQKFLQEKFVRDQPLSFHMQQSIENSSFIPSNSYVNMMPSFEPRLQMNSINRPNTANIFRSVQSKNIKNKQNQTGDESNINLQVSGINQNSKSLINSTLKPSSENKQKNKFNMQSVFVK